MHMHCSMHIGMHMPPERRHALQLLDARTLAAEYVPRYHLLQLLCRVTRGAERGHGRNGARRWDVDTVGYAPKKGGHMLSALARAALALAATLGCQAAVYAFTPMLPARRLTAGTLHIPAQECMVRRARPYSPAALPARCGAAPSLALRAAASDGVTADDGDDAEWAAVDYGATLSVLSLTCVSSASAEHASVGMDVEVLTELLMENGALSVVVEDADYGTERERHKFSKVRIILALHSEHARALTFSEFLPGPSLTSEPGSRAKAGSGCQAKTNGTVTTSGTTAT
jgi:hypothetical protein